jgi:iron(II)-dependent oxidoreductase
MGELRLELDQARSLTDDLFHLVRPDSLYERPIPERHRIIFYLGHLEAFDWNMICRWGLSVPAFHEDFDKLFAFGIDPGADGLPQDKSSDWPGKEEVDDYNRRVRETVDRLLGEAPEQIVHVAIEHRLMHAETFAYMLHNLPLDRKAAPSAVPAPAAAPSAAATIEIPAGTITLGRPRNGGFGWDNEFEAHSVSVPTFAIDKYKVTNGEYLEFVRAGAEAPHFWKPKDSRWLLRTMFGEIPLPLHWPVYVTRAQAASYARWKGKALPTEVQLQRAAYGTLEGLERLYPWGDAPPDTTRGNFDFGYWDPIPVGATPKGDSAFGVSQLVGNGWEWTSSLFRPFPGFQQFPFYPGYSANFFDDDHYVLKGASPRTAGRLLRSSFRNWFRGDYPYVYATFRCVEN